jgi:cobalt-zinc-cadmium efflux system protein
MENISATAQNRRGLWVTFALTFVYFVVEVVGGILTNSLALLADAAHMLTAFLEVLSDALGSVGVIIAGVIMLATDWYYADPLFSVLIGVFILPPTWTLLKQSVNVLLEGTPVHISPAEVEQAMLKVDGVKKIHDLHVWTITSGIEALSTHVVLADNYDPKDSDRVLERLAALLKERFGIDHSTIQIEKSTRHEREMQH